LAKALQLHGCADWQIAQEDAAAHQVGILGYIVIGGIGHYKIISDLEK